MHNALTFGKCLLHHGNVYRRPMTSISERLRSCRAKAGYDSAKSAAEAMGVPVATYIQHENGSRGIPKDRAERYARFFRVSPEWLLFGPKPDASFEQAGTQLFVKGEVAAGVWRDAWEYEADEWEVFTGRSDIAAPVRRRFGLRIVGDSMNEIYPDSSIVECVQYDGEEPIQTGKRVVVQRQREDGSVETTVKELALDDRGNVWLVPRSTNPAFQIPIRTDIVEPGIIRTEIIAIVVASIRPE